MNRRILLAQAKNFFADVWQDIIVFFNSLLWHEIIIVLKVVLITLSVLMIIGIIIVWIKRA